MTNLDKLKAYYPSMPKHNVLEWLLQRLLSRIELKQRVGGHWSCSMYRGHLENGTLVDDSRYVYADSPIEATAGLVLKLIEAGHIKPERAKEENNG